MATTIPPKPECCHSASTTCFPRRAGPFCLVVLVAGGGTGSALAERWQIEPAAETQLQWTSNSDFGRSQGKEDTVVQVKPKVTFRGEGARLNVSGTVAFDGVAYVNRTQDSRIAPQADVTARLEAVERFFYVEAGYRATQVSEDPFSVRPESGSTVNSVTTTQSRLSPYIQGTAPGDVRYSVRSDNSWVREIGGTSGVSTTAGYFGRHTAEIQKAPRPLGWRLELERSVTRYENAVDPDFKLDLARLFVNYALTPEFVVAVRGGVESNNLVSGVERRRISGVEANWTPSPRTTFNVYRENRFFGPAWRGAFSHRMPRVAFNVTVTRNVETAPQSVFELPATANVAGLLDQMYTTRYPDPVERARVVQDVINRNGLPTSTAGATALLSDRVSLATRREASLAFNGVRNTLTLTGYHVLIEDLPDSGALVTGTALGNNVQQGGSVLLNHNLSPLLALNVALDWSHIRALGAVGNEQTRQRNARVQVNVKVSPKTNAFLGGRHRTIDSNVVQEGKESGVFVGMDHRF